MKTKKIKNLNNFVVGKIKAISKMPTKRAQRYDTALTWAFVRAVSE